MLHNAVIKSYRSAQLYVKSQQTFLNAKSRISE